MYNEVFNEIIERYEKGLSMLIGTNIEGVSKYKDLPENIKYVIVENPKNPDLRYIITCPNGIEKIFAT
jgi:hypothetical protein